VSVADLGRSVPAPILLARSLGRKYEGFMALGSLSVEVPAGEMVALIGPNGAGKTTFLTIAAGLLDPTSGLLEVEGARAGSIEARRAVSYLPDSPVFYDDLSRGEHREYVAALHGAGDDGSRGRGLLERLGLESWEQSLPSEFSRGMRQKASIALALVRPFSILLADEPFDGLDPPSREVLFELIAEARADGAAVLVSTHRRDVIAAADRCLALRDGRLAYDGPPDAETIDEFFELSAASEPAPEEPGESR
jgi:ABC-type multidrug transport system ATPase subunit